MLALLFLGALLLGILLCVLALDVRLAVRRYILSAKGLKNPLRVVLLADHHASRYGYRQEPLLAYIHGLAPDLVLMAGDMVDDKRPIGEAALLFQGLQPYRVYYSLGNHELRRADIEETRAIAARRGVTVLTEEMIRLEIKGQPLHIGGIDDPDKRKGRNPAAIRKAAIERMLASAAPGPGYRVLIAHKPEFIKLYAPYGFDLVVSGHAHGGQVRIPGLLNGLFSPGQGLFPRWAGGVYQHGKTSHVVSRGLSRTVFPPRVFNRPEIVVIDLEPS